MNARNHVANALGALAVVLVLGIDDFDQEGISMQQSRVDWDAAAELAEWSSYNASQDRTLAVISGLPVPEPSSDEVETIEVSVDATPALRELLGAVRGAAAELEGGANDAVAADLLTALGRFCNQTGVKP